MALKYPPFYFIKGKTWKIDFVDECYHKGDWGTCYIDDREIEVRESLSDFNKLKTVAHEFYHSLEQLGIKIPHDDIRKMEKPTADFILLMIACNQDYFGQ